MYRKIAKQIISIIIISVIPALLSYLSNSSLIFDKLIKHGFLGTDVNVPLIQDYCLRIGILFSAIMLSGNLIVTKIKYDHILEQRNSLIKMNKYIVSTSLGKRFLSESSSFDIRIFIPKNPKLYRIANKFKADKIKQKFIIKNFDLIADQGITKGLQFEVYPNPEGLVGLCYTNKAMVYDDDLENTNDKKYTLNKSQINRTSNLKWSICCPICDNDNVVAVIALDGKTKITIDKDTESALREEMVSFSCLLYDSVPQLFKR